MKAFNDHKDRIGGILCLALLVVWGCKGQIDSTESAPGTGNDSTQQSDRKAVIAFDTLSHDFGTVIEGERVVCYFDYTNSGDQELVINDVEAGCGCTSPDWSREPLPPGETEQLKVIFDSSGTSGTQRKSVTVVSNADNSRVRIVLTARVEGS